VIVNVFGFAEDEYVEVVEKLNGCEGISAYELNISCPNTERGGMVFGTNPELTRNLTKTLRSRSKRPLWVKLSPNAGDIVSIARSAEEAGADCLVIANTFLSLKIRTDNFRPALGNKFGGLVSPALKPIVLRMVYQVAKQVKIPIIGIGGVTKAEDVVEYMLAGASSVGIGYAGFRNPTALVQIIDDLEAWCDERGIKKVTELIGAVKDADMESDTLVAASVGV
jgi:dihydroorotate dehydrogenase (NAD+) catalytic subunit